MQCPVCSGGGCSACEGSGRFSVTECPRKLVPHEAWEMIEAADMTRRGLPPVAGGSLDQTQTFLDACRFIWADESVYRSQAGGPLAGLAALLGG